MEKSLHHKKVKIIPEINVGGFISHSIFIENEYRKKLEHYQKVMFTNFQEEMMNNFKK